MSQLQKTFTARYTAQLKEQARRGEGLENYGKAQFPFDPDKVRFVPGVRKPDGLLDKMLDAKDDFEAAVALYEAYPTLTPLEASSEEFWAYLTHVDLLQYCQKRWPNVLENNFGVPQYVLDHWFIGGNGAMRNALAFLWWGVHFTKEKEAENADPYHLTKIFFKDTNLGKVHFVIILRTREALLGILEYLEEANWIWGKLRFKARFLAQHFNRMGGTRQLSYLPRSFFKAECERLEPTLRGIKTLADLRAALGVSALQARAPED